MLFYFAVRVCFIIYIYSPIRVIHPNPLFFSVQNHGCFSSWVSLAKAAQCLTVAAACSDGGLGEHDLNNKLWVKRWLNWPRFFFGFVVLKRKIAPLFKKYPTCLYIIEGLSTGVWTENEKFINVCWQLLHSTPYPKVAGSFVATWSYKCHSATRHGVLHQVVAKQWFCAQHIAQALALAAQNAVPPAKLMTSQSPCKRRGTCCW